MLTNGNYKVTAITDCFIGESKEKKTPFFSLVFKLEGGESVPWTVYLSSQFTSDDHRDMAKKNMDTLVMLGFKGSRLSDMAEAKVSDVFDPIEDEINVVVEMEQYTDKDGNQKEKAKVKFVNVGSFVQKMDKKQAVAALKNLAYDGFFAQSKNSLKPNFKKFADSGVSSEDVPF